MGNLFSKQEKYLPRCYECWKKIRPNEHRYASVNGDVCPRCWEKEFKKNWGFKK